MTGSAHYLLHAVTFALVAILMRKNLNLEYRIEELQMECLPQSMREPMKFDSDKISDDLTEVGEIKKETVDDRNSLSSDDSIDELGATEYSGTDNQVDIMALTSTENNLKSSEGEVIVTPREQHSSETVENQNENSKTASDSNQTDKIVSSQLHDSGWSDEVVSPKSVTKEVESLSSDFVSMNSKEEEPLNSDIAGKNDKEEESSNSDIAGKNDKEESLSSDTAGKNAKESSDTAGKNAKESSDTAGKNGEEETGKETEFSDTPSSATSVWCQGKSLEDRICHFKNLCYNSITERFMFLHDNLSILHTTQSSLNIQSFVQLSTVADFNGHNFYVDDLLLSNFKSENITWIKETSLLFSRFKPDNLMHVMHDDLFPLHFMLQFLKTARNKNGRFNVQLVLMEGWEPGAFIEMYKIFSSFPLMFKQHLTKSHYTCFRDVYTGLSKDMTWYKYGYTEPQGPVINSSATGYQIHDTIDYIVTQLSITNLTKNFLADSIMLLSRKENRLMLNEIDFMLHLSRELRMKVIIVSFETHSLLELMEYVKHCKGIVGMHGSLLTLASFLKPGSFVIELFPYAVNPEKYTPFKTLSQLPGMDLVYVSWQNTQKNNTVGHPDWPAHIGGINHLPQKEQTTIVNQIQVPDHLCCEDPSWLYHIYQDTKLDIDNITQLVRDAIQATHALGSTLGSRLYPAKVDNILCEVIPIDKAELNSRKIDTGKEISSNSVKVTWSPPMNIHDLDYKKLQYQVIAVDAEESERYIDVSEAQVVLSDLQRGEILKLWIRVAVDDRRIGLYNYKECTNV